MEEPQREYYYEERRRQLSRREVRVPIPDRQKVVRRIKGAAPARMKSKYRENSAAFAQNAGALLTRLSKVQSRVRTLSGCPDAVPEAVPEAEEPQLNYDGELDQVMLMV